MKEGMKEGIKEGMKKGMKEGRMDGVRNTKEERTYEGWKAYEGRDEGRNPMEEGRTK